MTGEEFLQSKDIWYHPYVSNTNGDIGYEVADLLDEFLKISISKISINGNENFSKYKPGMENNEG